MSDAPEADVETIEERCFLAWVKGMSYAAIAREVGLDYRRVKKHVDAESRGRKLALDRDAVFAQQAGTYQRVRERALELLASDDPITALTAVRAVTDVNKALDRLHGLVTSGSVVALTPMSPLADAVNALPREALYAFIRSIAERERTASGMRRALPADSPDSIAR
jgi:hypothetical protein